MKGKILIILSTVALLHIVVGALMLTNGCETADYDPMPPGAYVSAPTPGDPLPDNAVNTQERVRTADPNVNIVLTRESDFVGPVSFDPPTTVDTEKPETAAVKYKVQKGDTLSKIASMYGVTVAELASYNGISKTNFIKVGQVIEIPPGGRTTPRANTTSTSSKSTSSKIVSTAVKSAVTPIPADGVYTVQKGDSFYKIGAKFGVKSADIAAYNNLTLEKPLQIGQKLNIPKPGASIPAAPAPVKNTTAPTGIKTNDLPKIDDLPDVAPVELSPAPTRDTGSSLLDTINDADTPAPSSSALLLSGEGEYDLKVTETDMTLAEIAEVFGCELSELKKLNPQLSQTGKIRAGTPVKLP